MNPLASPSLTDVNIPSEPFQSALHLRFVTLGVLILTTGLGELLPKITSLLLEEYNAWPLLIVRVPIRPLSSIVVLG